MDKWAAHRLQSGSATGLNRTANEARGLTILATLHLLPPNLR
jgi:hypothetical protein